MDELLKEIKEKLDKESTEPYTNNIAEYLIKAAESNEDLRSMILDQSKTLTKCFSYIKGKAQKQAKNGCACIRNDIVYGWAVEYYGLPASEFNKVDIEEDEETEEVKEIKPIRKAPEKPVKKEKTIKEDGIAGQMDLFSFLG